MTDSSGTTTWGYDNLYRLTSVDYPSGDDVGYTYDAVGNRETLTVGTVVSDSTYNTLNQLTAIDETDDGTDDITYGYDDNGNLTSKTTSSATTTYAWDTLNRLTSVTSGGSAVASYAYNGDGLRASKTVGATTTDFTWDPTGLGTVINVDDGAIDDDYLWGLGLIGRIDSSGSETYAHSDGLGSLRSISDSMGTEIGAIEYDAFGATRSTTGVSYAFGFTGEQLDAETALVYLRARYMDPSTGRFISNDPIGLAGGDVNLYVYVANNPLHLVDPSGLCLTDVAGGGMNKCSGIDLGLAFAIVGLGTVAVISAVIVEEEGVKIWWYPNDHGPPHVHVKSKDGETRAGQAGRPAFDSDRPLSKKEQKVWDKHKKTIQKEIRDRMRQWRDNVIVPNISENTRCR